MGFPQLLLYATPVFFLAMWIEYKMTEGTGIHLYTRKDFITNIILGSGGVLFGVVSSSVGISLYYLVYTAFAPIRLKYIGYESLGWGPIVWIVAMLADDFTYYWFHRTSHRIRILWACHIVHHNSERYNFSTSLRNGWFAILYKPVFWYWLAATGIHPLMILTCMAINIVYQFFCHTTMMPWLDTFSGILNTPGLHAIHHGKDDHCIDKNYAGIFIFFDRLFGTYQPIDRSRTISYGVTHPPRSENFYEVTIHEFRNILGCWKTTRSYKHRLLFLFKGPEWMPSIKRDESTRLRFVNPNLKARNSKLDTRN